MIWGKNPVSFFRTWNQSLLQRWPASELTLTLLLALTKSCRMCVCIFVNIFNLNLMQNKKKQHNFNPKNDHKREYFCVILQSEDFFSLIEANEGKPLKLLVYNTQTDRCREAVVTPNADWGGEGRLVFCVFHVCTLIDHFLLLIIIFTFFFMTGGIFPD